ncbi:MAG: histidine kinase [Spirosomataceae bacterium]
MFVRRYAYYRFFWHVAFWLGYVCYRSVIFGLMNRNVERSFLITCIELPSYLLVTYVTLYGSIPRFLRKGQYQLFVGVTLLVLLLGGFTNYTLRHFTQEWYMPETGWESLFWSKKSVFSLGWCIFFTTMAAGVALATKLTKDWYVDQQIHKRLLKEKMAAELKFLKAQLNPHFLFNTLNNLYGLTLKNSTQAPDVVLRLSQLMHYMTYESNQDRVSLAKEVEHLHNYIELERLRYDDRLRLTFEVEGDLQQYYIAPLLILPFIENTFKHGASEQTVEAWIQIEIKVDSNQMNFKIVNNKQPFALKKRTTSGIGMQNVVKRLELIYPSQHTLHVQEEDTVFTVNLNISPPT